MQTVSPVEVDYDAIFAKTTARVKAFATRMASRKPGQKKAKKPSPSAVPMEERVKRWGQSLAELLQDPIGRHVLEKFLESEFSAENIRFWTAIQDLKLSPDEQAAGKAARIVDQFLVNGAPFQVNVDARTLEKTLHSLRDDSIPNKDAFSTSEKHIFALMSTDSYPRFLRSQLYKGFLSEAQQQDQKARSRRGRFVPSKLVSHVSRSIVQSITSIMRRKNIPKIEATIPVESTRTAPLSSKLSKKKEKPSFPLKKPIARQKKRFALKKSKSRCSRD